MQKACPVISNHQYLKVIDMKITPRPTDCHRAHALCCSTGVPMTLVVLCVGAINEAKATMKNVSAAKIPYPLFGTMIGLLPKDMK